jgi:hypothetical protein
MCCLCYVHLVSDHEEPYHLVTMCDLGSVACCEQSVHVACMLCIAQKVSWGGCTCRHYVVGCNPQSLVCDGGNCCSVALLAANPVNL